MLRKTTQHLLPLNPQPTAPGVYDIYPCFPLAGPSWTGYAALARQLADQPFVVIDGCNGVFWDELVTGLQQAWQAMGLRVSFQDVRQALKPATQLEDLLSPFLGGDDPLFGFRCSLELSDLFDSQQLQQMQPGQADIEVLYGPGAALAGWPGVLCFAELPKNEVQFRSRAGNWVNLGHESATDPRRAYKQLYFVDWVLLSQHKQRIWPQVEVWIDSQRPGQPVFARGDSVRQSLEQMAQQPFRVRPWFEPGVWGGQWIRQKIGQLAQDVPNYAWSFELIVPENGFLLHGEGGALELPFELLMYQQAAAVLGLAHARFGHHFPIRFDFLDTFAGGNLSLQCHPRPQYAAQQFGEPFTQDETYYILDAGPQATVYLGFQEGIQPDEFRQALEKSVQNGHPVDVERFVQVHPARKHDLFLIPSGTVHCAGEGSLVLEISATPYIFTFKMYDWLRLDLEGKPRPLNLDRAFDNLIFERAGPRVKEELIAHPRVVAQGPDWQVVHLATHPKLFYDVIRLELENSLEGHAQQRCLVMSLVEGQAIRVETDHSVAVFNYAETFVIPAATGFYRITHLGAGLARVIQAFVKQDGMAVWP